MYEIIDNQGVIHSGSHEEMVDAFEAMINPEDVPQENKIKYYTPWRGDLKLVQVLECWA